MDIKKPKWKNRIVENSEVDPTSLMANPVNFRKHPQKQREALNGSIDSLGWIQQIIVNRNSGRIIDGHLRVEEAISIGETAVPVQWVDLSEEEELVALMSLDPIAAMAETNKNIMKEVLCQIKNTQDELAPYLKGVADNSGLDVSFFEKNEPNRGDDDNTTALTEKWGVEYGQLWKLGEHRLLCGSCVVASDVERVLGGGGYRT